MSAWIVSREHIDVLVQGLAESEIVVDVPPDEIGRTLWRENLASIAHRYPQYNEDGERPGPIDFKASDVDTYTYTRPAERPSHDSLLKQAHCYDYQTCEHPEYQESTARGWVKQLSVFLTDAGVDAQGDAYARAPWGIDR